MSKMQVTYFHGRHLNPITSLVFRSGSDAPCRSTPSPRWDSLCRGVKEEIPGSSTSHSLVSHYEPGRWFDLTRWLGAPVPITGGRDTRSGPFLGPCNLLRLLPPLGATSHTQCHEWQDGL
ncbi:unnamed protein product [Pleuronectes platessa]|uniref:Uncharacterized protein n=1 Tax=Pleuronectes platessa TaxID=8262 RepID=A0A9N7Z3Z1_PLEPL|nr:unnamed protein product [Pleuronectes platessa]